eukprot:9757884-Alexandrium_andersonii.AAC.1
MQRSLAHKHGRAERLCACACACVGARASAYNELHVRPCLGAVTYSWKLPQARRARKAGTVRASSRQLSSMPAWHTSRAGVVPGKAGSECRSEKRLPQCTWQGSQDELSFHRWRLENSFHEKS